MEGHGPKALVVGTGRWGGGNAPASILATVCNYVKNINKKIEILKLRGELAPLGAASPQKIRKYFISTNYDWIATNFSESGL